MAMLRRKKKYGIEEVLSKTDFLHIDKKDSLLDFDGDLMKMNSWRLKTFVTSGVKCVKCGIEGQYFVKEKDINAERYHFNLYAINEKGKEVLMTKNRITPKVKGERNKLSHFQTMCCRCNKVKGDKIEEKVC